MVFTSWAFVAFLAVVLAGLSAARTREQRQLLILLASIYFYGYWQPWYLLLLATPSAIDYVCALRIEASDVPRVRKRWLLVSLVTNLGLLGYFKYANFFVANVSALFGLPQRHLDILLPVGISFYTFKTLSYTIDVYRRELAACRSLWKYAMFVTYFPELVAGPIVRASIFLPQMVRPLTPSWRRATLGFQLILLGVTKKLLIADRMSAFIDPVFASPHAFDGVTVAAAVVAYSLQIYCDFSGYSDIAIGVSRVIGFDLPENFAMPYSATSITEFWRRWHITLSQWLRDYLYIPLGGNRGSEARTYRNLMLTMLIGGLWHGAAWTFIAWGAYHGLLLAVHRRFGRAWDAMPALARQAGMFLLALLGWVFFRATSFGMAMDLFRRLFVPTEGSLGFSAAQLPVFALVLAVAATWAMAGPNPFEMRHELRPYRRRVVMVGAFAASLAMILSSRYSPFLYFQF